MFSILQKTLGHQTNTPFEVTGSIWSWAPWTAVEAELAMQPLLVAPYSLLLLFFREGGSVATAEARPPKGCQHSISGVKCSCEKRGAWEGGCAFLPPSGNQSPQNPTSGSCVPAVCELEHPAGRRGGRKYELRWETSRRFTWLKFVSAVSFAKAMPRRAQFGSVQGGSGDHSPHSPEKSFKGGISTLPKLPISKSITAYKPKMHLFH